MKNLFDWNFRSKAYVVLGIFISVQFFTSKVQAQADSTSYDDYLSGLAIEEDRTYHPSFVTNVIKTDLMPILDGHIPIIWQRKVFEHFYVDIAPGLLLNYTVNDVLGLSEDDDFLSNFINANPKFKPGGLGWAFYVEPKYFSSKLRRSYYNVKVGYKQYPTSNVTEIGFGRGSNWDAGKFNWDYNLGICFAKQNLTNGGTELKYQNFFSEFRSGSDSPWMILIKLNIQLGYIL